MNDSMRRRAPVRTVSLTFLLSLAGCVVGPDYQKPAPLTHASLPSTFRDPLTVPPGDWKGEWKIAAPAAQLSRGAWWEIFNDPELTRLEQLATQQNQQVATALANVGQARAAIQTARAAWFPQVNAGASLNHERTSANTSPSSAAAGKNRIFELYDASSTASWELDLWGATRRAVEGAEARAAASNDNYEAALLLVQAEVASDYFSLHALDQQSALLAQTRDADKHALEITRNRYRSGVASSLDVAQAETQLQSVQVQLPAVDLQRAQLRHALAVLCGEPATTFRIQTSGQKELAPPSVPLSVPSEWLEQRPDIAAAERTMAAANADIGVAKSAFYPNLVLNGSGGFESITAGNLLTAPSFLWAIGPSIQLPLLNGGRNRAQLEASYHAYDAAVATYRQTVLTAFQDVEDQLAAGLLLQQQLAEQEMALKTAQRTLTISNNQYKAGITTYLNVVTAQAAYLSAQQSVIQLKAQHLNAAVGLIKALGAGWKSS